MYGARYVSTDGDSISTCLIQSSANVVLLAKNFVLGKVVIRIGCSLEASAVHIFGVSQAYVFKST
jgi:hypothetical protein